MSFSFHVPLGHLSVPDNCAFMSFYSMYANQDLVTIIVHMSSDSWFYTWIPKPA